MIRKPSVIITSLGRTGTKFFHVFFSEIIADATVLHEPDYFNFGQYHGCQRKLNQTMKQFSQSGIYWLILRKMVGRWNLVSISDARFLGEIGYQKAVQKLLDQRKKFIYSQSGGYYVEASSAFYGLIDLLPKVFDKHLVFYIIRDGRDWVQSKMNFGNMYQKSGLRGVISRRWPMASEVAGDKYQMNWQNLSRFEKICWAWSRLNSYAIKSVRQNPSASLIHFEDVFVKEDRDDVLLKITEDISIHTGIEAIISRKQAERFLKDKIHESEKQFPSWNDWPADKRSQFVEICGPLMERLGYEL